MHTLPAWELPDTISVQHALDRYLMQFPREKRRLDEFSCHLARAHLSEDIFSRKKLPGHVTASGIVYHAEKLLLINHPHLHQWMPPGGHLDEGESPEQAAMREVMEETGMACSIHPWHQTSMHPLDIDLHTIGANTAKGEPEHWHCDFRYLLTLGSECSAGELTHGWKAIEGASFAGVARIQSKLSEIHSTGP